MSYRVGALQISIIVIIIKSMPAIPQCFCWCPVVFASFSFQQCCKWRWWSRTTDCTERKKSTGFGMRNTSFLLFFFVSLNDLAVSRPQPSLSFRVVVFVLFCSLFVFLLCGNCTYSFHNITNVSVSFLPDFCSVANQGSWVRDWLLVSWNPRSGVQKTFFSFFPFSLIYGCGGGGEGGGGGDLKQEWLFSILQ